MEVPLSSETQARLAEIAQARGGKPELIAREAIERFVEYDDWFVREVERGIASAAQGQMLSHEEVGERLEELIRRRQPSHR